MIWSHLGPVPKKVEESGEKPEKFAAGGLFFKNLGFP